MKSIGSYSNFYGVDGIFFDESNSSKEAESYYKNLKLLMKNRYDISKSIINPGVVPDKIFLNSANSLNRVVIFEGSYEKFEKTVIDLSDFKNREDAFICMIYGTPFSNMKRAIDSAIKKECGHIYVTDDEGVNPWDRLPTYWSDFIDYISKINSKN